MPAPKRITPGMRFGRLVVLHEVERQTNAAGLLDRKPRLFCCQCDCGVVKKYFLSSLLMGLSKSCGCFHKEQVGKLRRTHGHTIGRTRTKLYQAWIGMRARCSHQNNPRFKDYGGRGIKVCDRWNESFECFRLDIGEPPSESHSIDRINNDGNYEPGNCRWATSKEQSVNKRTARKRTIS